DNIAPIVNEVYANPATFHSLEVFAAIILFSFQIYADFYGYSTIAIGAARLLGIHLIDNFKTPYLATSINDFWKRWHISLTSWFREYVYIPLGGSRSGNAKWVFNILVIFFISGLWHGASWTFVVWGLLHGAFYLLERLFNYLFKVKIKEGFSALNLFLGIKTFVLVSFIWIFFRAESFEKAKDIIKAFLKNWNAPFNQIQLNYALLFVLILIISDVLLYKSRIDHWLHVKKPVLRWSVYALLLFSLMGMSGMDNLPFIYFQF
ncbi:MAG: MBOAT family protein, partial [Bacteroidia bacterium]|nr:MBOAT family protein [Bacteroidia bacterium]